MTSYFSSNTNETPIDVGAMNEAPASVEASAMDEAHASVAIVVEELDITSCQTRKRRLPRK